MGLSPLHTCSEEPPLRGCFSQKMGCDASLLPITQGDTWYPDLSLVLWVRGLRLGTQCPSCQPLDPTFPGGSHAGCHPSVPIFALRAGPIPVFKLRPGPQSPAEGQSPEMSPVRAQREDEGSRRSFPFTRSVNSHHVLRVSREGQTQREGLLLRSRQTPRQQDCVVAAEPVSRVRFWIYLEDGSGGFSGGFHMGCEDRARRQAWLGIWA